MPAAVMILLYPKDGEFCVLLNKRSMTVEHHKGEIVLPRRRPRPRRRRFRRHRPSRDRRRKWASPETTLRSWGVLTTTSRVPTSSSRSSWERSLTPTSSTPARTKSRRLWKFPSTFCVILLPLRWDSRIENGERISVRSYGYQQHLVYGATAKILDQFLDTIDAELRIDP